MITNHQQEVILVNENDEMTGTMEKMQAHEQGLLHRAFSIFIFNRKGEMLIQQRAENKYHSPNLWTNACCSHPAPGESTADAAHRRLMEEMGFDTLLEPAFHFTYQAAFENGLTEYEFDHVFIGDYDDKILPHVSEVKDYCFVKMEALKESLDQYPHKYTAWFRIAFPLMENYLSQRRLAV